jgi:Na+/proline symporter
LGSPFATALAPWLVLAAYCAFVWAFAPRRVGATQFFTGTAGSGRPPGLWLVAMSAAITWIFAKSIANAASLGQAFGWIGGLGYATYYLSFAVAAAAIYLIRTRGGHRSLAGFLTHKYGPACARLFLIAVAIRLFNEVWSNTKVGALYFGAEGSAEYWVAALAITGFTAAYSWQGGLRSSLLTDAGQTLLAAVLLAVVLVVVLPPVAARGLPATPGPVHLAGLTFLALAAVQVLSYPFHDPVLTDRGFLNDPRTMVKALLLAGLISGTFILLFSSVGIYAREFGVTGPASVAVPAALGLTMMLVFNAIMLTSAGSTLDSTFASTAKLAALDWHNADRTPSERQRAVGRCAVIAVALVGNLPLLAIYLGDGAGPAVIAATTISGTMVMGLAPIFLLAFVRPAGAASFHLAFWPGLALGVLKTIEDASGAAIFPTDIAIGSGAYADDLGVNVYGLVLCTMGYLAGAALSLRRASAVTRSFTPPAS